MGFYNRRPQQALTDVKITSVYIISDVMFTSKCYHMMYQNLVKVLDYAGFCSWVIRDPVRRHYQLSSTKINCNHVEQEYQLLDQHIWHKMYSNYILEPYKCLPLIATSLDLVVQYQRCCTLFRTYVRYNFRNLLQMTSCTVICMVEKIVITRNF